jgi:predicted CoA-binding protein
MFKILFSITIFYNEVFMTTKEMLTNYKSIAVVGFSANTEKTSHRVPIYMIEQGYDVIPVNPVADKIAGLKVYHDLASIPEEIDIVNVFRPSADCLNVAKEAVERKKSRGDVKVLWLQEGIVNEEARKLAEDNEILFIEDKCILKEHSYNF